MTVLTADERRELAQSVRSVCERLSPEERVRQVAYGEDGGERSGFDTSLWDVLCNQVGVAAIALPEHLGGAGYGASALGVVAHELGRALAPVPFVSSAVLATGLLLDLTEHDPDAEKRFAELAEGRRTAAAALTGDGGLWRRSAVTTRAAADAGDWSIDGTVRHVVGGSAAADLVVTAVADDELAIFLIDPTADGVTVTAESVLDGTRPMATVTLTAAPAVRLTGEGSVESIIERNVHVALAVLSAEQVGACERLLEIATDYARTREQFGRPIGSFQAIKHKCADMLVDLEWARSASQAAMQALDDSGDASAAAEADWRASMAKAVCSEALRDAASTNIQIHGGIGFTWEDPSHLYLRRARTDEVVLGTPAQHWDRLAILTGLSADGK
ncbi:acyl-CoA dehydrogenase family protein [Mycolicibacterium sp.]|uniref:acyl-CoA dehydrogenase family protein n=1 Tax=Mycolicibacterium sp. TaxID=2320850 RepID=UPI001A2E4EFF|nr:acyl-CoA dehydrogenase family protein [Mycolicibacterium sp.]MBJ7336443.1 acyl-CoA dehydrogenase family protein [Mycolicibacterium sp.]